MISHPLKKMVVAIWQQTPAGNDDDERENGLINRIYVKLKWKINNYERLRLPKLLLSALQQLLKHFKVPENSLIEIN